MPKLTFDHQSQTLSIVLSTPEKILTVKWNGGVTIPFAQIRGIRTRPAEAYKLVKGVKVGSNIPGIVTDAVFYHTDGSKPDLHLYATCDKAVALDLDGHEYGIVVIQLENESPVEVARRIKKESGWTGEIQDDQEKAE
ncbi:hypothetical protein HDU98_012236 [Podochytrium sp. JEL0797]|nr:hypothetical protein HDU98_012236 [Podochytrium sp. JEL0797]